MDMARTLCLGPQTRSLEHTDGDTFALLLPLLIVGKLLLLPLKQVSKFYGQNMIRKVSGIIF